MGVNREGGSVLLLKLLLKHYQVNHCPEQMPHAGEVLDSTTLTTSPFLSYWDQCCTASFAALGLLHYVFSVAMAVCFMLSEPAQVSYIKLVADIYGVPGPVGGLDKVSPGSSC